MEPEAESEPVTKTLRLKDYLKEPFLTPKRRELLLMVRKLGSNLKGVGHLANSLNRRLDAVSHDLKSLERIGIISIDRSGRNRIPRVALDRLVLEI